MMSLRVGAEALPVDVEGAGRRRQLAPFQHRQPPWVVGAADAHMVRHDVEHEAEAVRAERVGETVEPVLATELRVDGRVVDDVVSVRRAGPRLVDRRGIDVADAQSLQIGRDRGGVVEREILVELQPVGGARRRRRKGACPASGAAPFGREGGGDLGELAARRGDDLERLGELAAPVGVAFGDAGHVRLAELAEHVLVLDGAQHAWRAREIAHHRFERRRFGRLGRRQEALRRKRGGELPTLADALGALALGALVVVDAERLAQIRVEAAPPRREGRQVVGGDGSQRMARIALRRLEGAFGLALELQYPVAQHPRAHDRVGETLRRRAEIFGDDESAGAVALEPQHGEERLEGVVDIGALRGGNARRDEEQAAQLEGVVDADGAGMAHIGDDQRPEGAEPLALEGERVERRQPPILPLRREKIGRRADRQGRAEALRRRPHFGAAAVGADGEVAVEPDAHAGRMGARRSGRQLRVGEPLQPGVERDALGMLVAEAAHLRRAAGSVRLRPVARPPRALGPEMLRQGLEGGVRFERLAEFAAESVESRIAPAGADIGEQGVEHRPQHGPHAGWSTRAPSRKAAMRGAASARRRAARLPAKPGTADGSIWSVSRNRREDGE